MMESDSFAELKTILSSLTEKEAQVIAYRFGLNDQDGKTLEQIGNTFGVTRERVRQIEAKAIRKLKRKAQYLNAQRENYLD